MSQPATEPAPAPSLRHVPRRYLALGLIIVAICLLGALVLVRDNSGPDTSSTVETFTPAPSSLLSTLSSVPASVYDTIGVSSPTAPVQAPQPSGSGSAPMWLAAANGGPPLPVVFFYGAEFAPYPAVQRWPLVLALSRFGTFKQLGLMQSSPTTAFANLSTFTFWNASYSSKYLILESVERYSALNPTGARYLTLERTRRAAGRGDQQLTARVPTPSPCSTWPTATSSTAPASPRPCWPECHRARSPAILDTPASPLTQAVVTAANEITATICAVDGDKPAAVCESRASWQRTPR